MLHQQLRSLENDEDGALDTGIVAMDTGIIADPALWHKVVSRMGAQVWAKYPWDDMLTYAMKVYPTLGTLRDMPCYPRKLVRVAPAAQGGLTPDAQRVQQMLIALRCLPHSSPMVSNLIADIKATPIHVPISCRHASQVDAHMNSCAVKAMAVYVCGLGRCPPRIDRCTGVSFTMVWVLDPVALASSHDPITPTIACARIRRVAGGVGYLEVRLPCKRFVLRPFSEAMLRWKRVVHAGRLAIFATLEQQLLVAHACISIVIEMKRMSAALQAEQRLVSKLRASVKQLQQEVAQAAVQRSDEQQLRAEVVRLSAALQANKQAHATALAAEQRLVSQLQTSVKQMRNKVRILERNSVTRPSSPSPARAAGRLASKPP